MGSDWLRLVIFQLFQELFHEVVFGINTTLVANLAKRTSCTNIDIFISNGTVRCRLFYEDFRFSLTSS